MKKKYAQFVGITGIYTESFDENAAWLGWFGVKKEYRKKGYGTKILQRTIDIAKSKGYETFRLYTDLDNYDAQSVYNKIMDSYETYTEKDIKVLIYSKSLTNKKCMPLNKFVNLKAQYLEQQDAYKLYKTAINKIV